MYIDKNMFLKERLNYLKNIQGLPAFVRLVDVVKCTGLVLF